jgi:hypothetical protein
VWYRWTKVQRADIPEGLRVQFEQLGAAVVTQIVGMPLTHSPQTTGVPQWAADPGDRGHALVWLREERSRGERRQDISEAVEVAILVLVAIEAIPILLGVAHHALRECGL